MCCMAGAPADADSFFRRGVEKMSPLRPQPLKLDGELICKHLLRAPNKTVARNPGSKEGGVSGLLAVTDD